MYERKTSAYQIFIILSDKMKEDKMRRVGLIDLI